MISSDGYCQEIATTVGAPGRGYACQKHGSDAFRSLVHLRQGQRLYFGSLSFMTDAAGHLVPAATLTEGYAFSFEDLANKLGTMQISDEAYDRCTQL